MFANAKIFRDCVRPQLCTVREPSTPLFDQLYTLHADVDGAVFPLSYLFGDSSERPPICTYPGILDDQPVARNVMKKKFPNTTIWGCFFTSCHVFVGESRNVAWRLNFGKLRTAVLSLYPVIELKMCGSWPWKTMKRPLWQLLVSRTT